MIGFNEIKNYPLTCPGPLWADWKENFQGDVNVNDALVATLARETLRESGEELDDNRREDYEQIVEEYDERRE